MSKSCFRITDSHLHATANLKAAFKKPIYGPNEQATPTTALAFQPCQRRRAPAVAGRTTEQNNVTWPVAHGTTHIGIRSGDGGVGERHSGNGERGSARLGSLLSRVRGHLPQGILAVWPRDRTDRACGKHRPAAPCAAAIDETGRGGELRVCGRRVGKFLSMEKIENELITLSVCRGGAKIFLCLIW